MDKASKFGKIRSIFWPIHRHELAKFLPMLLIFFLITFNYNLLRITKDTLIVTAPNSGAETLPFLKVAAILPMAILLTALYTKLSGKYNREKVFYIMLSIFLAFFALFTLVLYPLREMLHPNDFANNLEILLPTGLRGLVAMLRNWGYTMFYVMSELWSTAILTVLFWGFANDITSVGEARRYYVILPIGGNLSTIISGQVSIFLSKLNYIPFLPYGNTPWDQYIFLINCIVLICGVGIVLLFWHMNKKSVVKDHIKISDSKPKQKLSLIETVSYLTRSKYLLCIAIIVLAYNISTSLVEIAWKNQVKLLYPDPRVFNAYIGKIMTAIGVVASLTAIFVSNRLLRKHSWTAGALIAPTVAFVTGILFFYSMIFKDTNILAILANTSPIVLSVFLGGLQNTLGRASKYTLFDATKEIAFIPLSQESRIRGKAAIDGIGSRLGKSGSSLIYFISFMFFSTISASIPIVAIIFLIILILWFIAAVSLGKQFNTLTAQQEQLVITETPAAAAKKEPIVDA